MKHIKFFGTAGMTAILAVLLMFTGCSKNTTVTVKKPTILPGKFSVSDTKQVQFTSGNLYYSTTDNAYHIESAQNVTFATLGQSEYTASHVCHFFWSNTTDWQTSGKEPWASKYAYSAQSNEDKFFCWEENAMTVDDLSGLYALSSDEWEYMLAMRTNAISLHKVGVSVTTSAGTVENCFIIAPDGYTGTIAESYTAAAWATAEADGLVCFPAAGRYKKSELIQANSYGYYWTSTPGINKMGAYQFFFSNDGLNYEYYDTRDIGLSIRLVSTVAE